MTKEDLRTGDIVVTRCGTHYMYFENYSGYDRIFVGIFCSDYMSSYEINSNMENEYGVKARDIMKVYSPRDPYSFPRNEMSLYNEYDIVFQREKKKISMSDAVKRLSEIEDCEVEIV